MYVLGIDAGGTKTVALLADADGNILTEGRAGAANLHTEGELEVEKILHTVIDLATEGRDVTLSAVALGIAGVDREDDARIIRGIMRRMGYRSNAVIVNDALIALVAGAGTSPGVVVIAGTGSIAYGLGPQGVAARAGGWGPTLGDEGSGYWVGRRALAAVMREADGRGPRTALTPLVLDHFSLPTHGALVAEIYHQTQGRRATASLAAVVDRARAEGDPVAMEIMVGAADELALAAASVINRLDMRGEQFPILLAGGMLRESHWLAAEVRTRMAEVAPRSTVALLTQEPAVGAVRLALAQARGVLSIPPYIDSISSTPAQDPVRKP
jgi:N-acetylglucosamine kinase-like BadF-type ATPase